MTAPFTLLQHTQQRLQLVKQLNATALFLALAVLGWVLSWLILHACALPLWWSLFPLVVSVGFWSLTIWRIGQEVDVTSAAHVVDSASQGKARFLTLATAPSTLAADSLQSVVLHQAEQLTASFQLEREVPLALERRTCWLVGAAAVSLLLLFLVQSPHSPVIAPSFFQPESATLSEEQQRDAALNRLEATARQLMTPTATAQEQIAGTQLQTLAQQLRGPSLSSQEQQQIAELQKRWNLDIPLPQLLPFDLQLLASNSKDDKGQDNEDKDAQGQQSSSAAGMQQNPEQSQPSSSPSEGTNQQQEPQKNGEKNNQPKPQQNGGNLALKFPQPQAKGQEQSPQETSGSEQTSAQGQKPDENLPGVDPNRPGDNQQAQNQPGNDPNQPNQQNQSGQRDDGQKTQEQEGGVGVGKGESTRKLGEQPGSGFLTEDARFVKVRVPFGQAASDGEDGRTEHTGRATPKTPYSNAPLKESAPEQAQTKQPIPLEYRSILVE